MVLTPDQKKRLAELDAQPSGKEQAEQEFVQRAWTNRLRSMWLSLRVSTNKTALVKILVGLLLIGVAGYFINEYQVHRIDFRKVISDGRGNPIERLWDALKLQKQKADMLDKGQSQFLMGDYKEALATAAAVEKLDAKDSRAQQLIDLAADAATRRAAREFDLGEIEAALSDARLALKYRSEHKDARDLSLRIGDRLLREARSHYSKNEYSQAITKAQEVMRIDPSDIGASNLLMRINNDLLTQAGELFINRRYFDALEKVRLSMRIDPTNSSALRLLNQISLYIETPEIKLRGITRFGDTLYAVIQLPNSSQPAYVKQGETVRNFKIVHIDPEAKTVKLIQIYTNTEFTIEWSKPE